MAARKILGLLLVGCALTIPSLLACGDGEDRANAGDYWLTNNGGSGKENSEGGQAGSSVNPLPDGPDASTLPPVSQYSPTNAELFSASSEVKAAANIGTNTPSCDDPKPGPKMVEIPAPDGSNYCIDSTEVTQGQYDEFLVQNKYKLGSQLEEYCVTWNFSFVPAAPDGCGVVGENSPSTPADPYNPVAYPDRPVICVDWCDARAYCAWARKRLCGKIGGGKTTGVAVNDPNRSEWYNACTAGLSTVYSRGNEPKSECAVAPDDGENPDVQDVPPDCSSSKERFNQVSSLSGGVGEWTDEIPEEDPTYNDGVTFALSRGGVVEQGKCSAVAGFAPTYNRQATFGFRCCSD